MSNRIQGSFVPVPEHEHAGPTDGTACQLCQFYQRGYWTGTDAILDFSRQTYDDGLRQGSARKEREYREAVGFLVRCMIYGVLLGVVLRSIADAREPSSKPVAE